MSQVDVKDKVNESVERWNYAIEDDSWPGRLLGAIAVANLCKVIRYELGKYAVFGTPSNLEIVEYMYGYLSAEVDRLSQQFCRGKGRAYFRGWRFGAISAIREKLIAGLQQFQSDANTTALVVNKTAQVDSYISTIFPHTISRKQSYNSSAFADGRSAGSKIGIRQGLKNGVGQHLLNGK